MIHVSPVCHVHCVSTITPDVASAGFSVALLQKAVFARPLQQLRRVVDGGECAPRSRDALVH